MPSPKHRRSLCLTCLILWMGLTSHTHAADRDCLQVTEMDSLTYEALDSLSFETCDPHQLIILWGAALHMSGDTLLDPQTKAEIYMSLIADEMQRRSELEGFDLEEATTAFLIDQLKTNQYHLNLERPSDLEKLVHYAEEGRWDYIGKRIVDRELHYVAIAGLAVVLMGFFWWRNHQKSRRQA